MLVFRYDKTFDGLLSAVFDAYSLHVFPEALIGPGEPEPLFTERVHDVVTDEAHAARVCSNGGSSPAPVRCSSMPGTGSRPGATC